MNRLTMKELQPDYRPDEKFLKYGPASLTDAELLAIILRTGTKENCSVEVAENILGFEDINQQDILNIQYLDMKDLLSIRGVGTVKALQVKAVAELSQRISNTSRRKTSVPALRRIWPSAMKSWRRSPAAQAAES